jgi:putative aldouronate transport system permease protein
MTANGKGRCQRILSRELQKNWELYLFLLPTVTYFLIFHYVPMYGAQIAFKDFVASRGIVGSAWAGFSHFERFFRSYQFWRLIRNTLSLSFYQLVAGFPIPIMLALLLNQLSSQRYKRLIQTVTYAPHFISTVVLVGILNLFLGLRTGLVNHAIRFFGGAPVFFLGSSAAFRHLYVLSGIWQNAGWSAVIYLAALSSVNPELYEAATVDGASRLQKILNVDIPGIMPTAIVLLVLNMGRVMRLGFEKVFLMQNALNLETSEIISTYVYKVGLLDAQYDFAAAVGLFNSLVNVVLLLSVNWAAKKITSTSLW